jgi:phenylpropionate dioxygenase-like ring-hydroxylating dioxygenase large terminal subunit
MNLQTPSPDATAVARPVPLPTWFAHWHPVARSCDVGRRPVARRILDREIVLFRTEAGRIGAMMNRCPHRGMRLSKGCVRAGRLICPYHGWSYDPEGATLSPGNPALRLTVPTFQTMERHGLIWLKERGSTDVLPDWARDGYESVHSGSWYVAAPVEVMLDNFSEVEHTATAHWQFGYDQSSVAEITNETRVSETAVEARTEGPQKKLSWPIRAFLGMRPGDLLCCEWVTEFTPLRSTWHWGWKDPKTRAFRGSRFCAVAYFHPIGEDACQLSTLYFVKGRSKSSSILWQLALPLLRHGINHEVKIDINLVENVRPQAVTSGSSHLGRFDKAIVEQRRRLDQIH